MHKFKVRYILECEAEFSAEDVQAADRAARERLARIHGDGLRSRRLLGVIPADQAWPDDVSDAPRNPGPRNTPPSGSPGTPTARLEEQPVPAVAA